jgi:multicomponent K+:H+ antiporter subunit F/multicomponent Na+:H+ antiporter subunit F
MSFDAQMSFELHPYVYFIMMGSFIFSMLVSTWMVWKGPNDSDRVVAMEWMGGISIALVAWYALWLEDLKLVDIALVLSILGYLTTASLSKWYEAKEMS